MNLTGNQHGFGRMSVKIYPEVRYCALGYINSRLYALVFTETALGIRVISLRKANKREVKKYEQNL